MSEKCPKCATCLDGGTEACATCVDLLRDQLGAAKLEIEILRKSAEWDGECIAGTDAARWANHERAEALAAELAAAQERIREQETQLCELETQLCETRSVCQEGAVISIGLTERIRDLEGVVETAREVFKVIATYPSEDGNPVEIVYDEYAYKRMVDSYRACARETLAALDTLEKSGGGDE